MSDDATCSSRITARILRNRPDLQQRQRVEQIKTEYGLKTAAEIGPPTPKTNTCPNCSAPLIEGACWACAI